MDNLRSQSKTGFALLLAVIITSIVLAIGLAILHITLKRIDLGVTAFGSETAFQTAASAADCLLYLGHAHQTDFLKNTPVQLDCLGQSGNLTQQSTSDPNVHEYISSSGGLDWKPAAGQDYCFALDIYVYNASGLSTPISYTIDPSGRNIQHTCSAGDVCTYGFARGFNASCSDVSSGGVGIYQRELSVNF